MAVSAPDTDVTSIAKLSPLPSVFYKPVTAGPASPTGDRFMDLHWREFSACSPREQPLPQGGHGWEVTQDLLSPDEKPVATG